MILRSSTASELCSEFAEVLVAPELGPTMECVPLWLMSDTKICSECSSPLASRSARRPRRRSTDMTCVDRPQSFAGQHAQLSSMFGALALTSLVNADHGGLEDALHVAEVLEAEREVVPVRAAGVERVVMRDSGVPECAGAHTVRAQVVVVAVCSSA